MIYIFDRDSLGQWGFTACDEKALILHDANGFETLYFAVEAAENHADSRGEEFEGDVFSIRSRPQGNGQ